MYMAYYDKIEFQNDYDKHIWENRQSSYLALII